LGLALPELWRERAMNLYMPQVQFNFISLSFEEAARIASTDIETGSAAPK
jgi:hypothetical protein